MTYTEEQRFTSPWLWILIFIITVVTVLPIWYMFFKQIIIGEQVGSKPISDTGMILLFFGVAGLMGAIIAFIYYATLYTHINAKGVSYMFKPFHRKMHLIPWEDIKSHEVIQYRPILDYGGWGIRYGRGGKAYNVQGNMGLFLTLKSGKTLLIGTQDPETLRSFMKSMPP